MRKHNSNFLCIYFCQLYIYVNGLFVYTRRKNPYATRNVCTYISVNCTFTLMGFSYIRAEMRIHNSNFLYIYFCQLYIYVNGLWYIRAGIRIRNSNCLYIYFCQLYINVNGLFVYTRRNTYICNLNRLYIYISVNCTFTLTGCSYICAEIRIHNSNFLYINFCKLYIYVNGLFV